MGVDFYKPCTQTKQFSSLKKLNTKININGKETARTDFGISQSPEYLILSVEIGGSNGQPDPKSWAGDIKDNDDLSADFVVDYVRAYQYKDKV